MSKDRLRELQATQEDIEGAGLDDKAITVDGLKEDFLNEVEEIRDKIDQILFNVVKVEEKQITSLSAPHKDGKVMQELEDLMSHIRKIINEVREKLKAIEQRIEYEEQAKTTSANLRIRKTQHSSLFLRLVEVITEYKKIQVDYQDRRKSRLQRHLQFIGKFTTDKELEEMLEQEFSMNPQQYLREIQDEILDMEILVENQDALVDCIEHHVKHSKDYVETATFR